MTQLSFQPAFDAFHAVFRFLRLRNVLGPSEALAYDKLRILDFYLLFPHKVRDIRLTAQHQKFKKLSDRYAFTKPYGELPDARLVFERMRPMQAAAIQTLAAKSLVSVDALAQKEVRATGSTIPRSLAERVAEINESQSDLMDFLATLASDYPLQGDNGLKARTGLLEHRYDAV
ncbi:MULTISPECIES: ABC-three component system middle component 5 [Mesorhizobium]|uniref:ABC-three component system middle component 5 n=1 Tax=Mesorhizobium TaxID=68287 RepID=UPI0007A9563A|nr:MULTISPECIES: ABC-three component system middle component 5 [Mesorhizobium]RUZ92447.1 hypothetical protein EN947_01195 [Mesorhizobium sp. M7A.F.Ca.US.003.02.2.1]AMX95904.1 hypothetical protein A4R28_24245 [Mesorhizobium ciceri]MDF3207340.1 hypothetical protein [Mesorhizobium sp. LMG15046]MDF3230909.1 hypothetical protein [Mesorhizobium sp. DSM 30133]RUU17232.1 hypothetical protein EOC84_25365 [Mesorhizobium sp. Primo-B]